MESVHSEGVRTFWRSKPTRYQQPQTGNPEPEKFRVLGIDFIHPVRRRNIRWIRRWNYFEIRAKVAELSAENSMHGRLQNKWENRKTMKKALVETQTLRAGRSNAEPKIFAPPQTPFPGAQDRQNLISRRWSLYLHLQTQFKVKIDARNFELSCMW